MSQLARLFSVPRPTLNRVLMIAAAIFLLSGCSARQAAKEDNTIVFYPPAPDPPRIQYLMGITDSRDVSPIEEKQKLISFKEEKADKVKVFEKPYGVAAGNSKVYIADSVSGKVSVIDFVAKSFEHLKGNREMGQLLKPVNLAVDNVGNLYVADIKREIVLQYDPDGNFIRTFGKGYGWKPVDVAVDDIYLYVLDNTIHEVFVLDKFSGGLVTSFGRADADKSKNLSIPTSISLGNNSNLLISNLGNGKVVEFDRDGHVLNSFGKLGDGFGMFGRPRGIDLSEEGYIYVTDARHQNVQIFDPEGRLLMFFGNSEKEKGSLSLPAGIAVTRENLDYFQQFAAPGFKLEEVIMVVNQSGSPKLSVFGRGALSSFNYDNYDQETQRQREQEEEAREALQKKRQNVTGGQKI